MTQQSHFYSSKDLLRVSNSSSKTIASADHIFIMTQFFSSYCGTSFLEKPTRIAEIPSVPIFPSHAHSKTSPRAPLES